MNAVPSYSLYGMSAEAHLSEAVHCESIAERSRLHAWTIKPHRHEHFVQILYVRHGGCEADLDQHRWSLDQGGLVCVPARCVHAFRFSEDVDGAVITLTEPYAHALLGAAPEAKALLDRPTVYPWDNTSSRDPVLSPALEMFIGEFATPAPLRGGAIGALLSLILIAVARLAAEQARGGAPPASRRVKRFLQFKQLVEQDFRIRRDLPYYARALGVTTTQLNRICRDVAHRTSLQILNERILAEAQRSLLYTELDVKQIAATLGFADAAYFTRFFVKHLGQPPTRFRLTTRARLTGSAQAVNR